MMTMK
jgi:hypothetical protein